MRRPEPVAPDQTSAIEVLYTSWRHRLATLTAGTRLLIAIGASALTALLTPTSAMWAQRAVASWNGFAVVALSLMWLPILTLKPAQIEHVARREDPSRVAALALVVVGAGISLLAVGVLLSLSRAMTVRAHLGAAALALSAVVLAWVLMHTVFTLRYAHLYYAAHTQPNGLAFPGDLRQPDYLDFAYFSFIIGMTAQTADVSITSFRLRRTALLHGVVAFGFNTAVIALSIGALSSVL